MARDFNKKKILVTGSTQSNFIKQLYSTIERVDPNKFEFDIVDLKELSGKDEFDGLYIFENLYNRRDYKNLWAIGHLFSLKFLSYIFFVIGRGNLSPIKILSLTKAYIIEANLYKKIKKQQYDIFHFHFPKASTLSLLWLLEKSDTCIVSFWGSDLLRISDYLNFCLQKRALERANIITTHSVEMREIILAKFGRDLLSKIRLTRFPPHEELYKLIEANCLSNRAVKPDFAEQYGFDSKKRWIVIGNNGSPYNNHLEIIKQLNHLPEGVKSELFIILPFSYQQSPDGKYEEQLKEAMKYCELDGVVFKQFLNWNELATFKCLTDIMIHLPASDALSGALTEAIYAGSKIITGSWLPYSPFKKAGLSFTEIESFDDLSSSFLAEYTNLKTEDKDLNLEVFRKAIRNNFFEKPCALTWIKVFSEL